MRGAGNCDLRDISECGVVVAHLSRGQAHAGSNPVTPTEVGRETDEPVVARFVKTVSNSYDRTVQVMIVNPAKPGRR